MAQMTTANPRRMTERLRVLMPADPADLTDKGEPYDAHQTAAEIWAEVESLSGKVLLQSGQMLGEVTHRVKIWPLPGLASDWRFARLNKGTTLHAIAPPIEIEDGRRQEVLCVERPD